LLACLSGSDERSQPPAAALQPKQAVTGHGRPTATGSHRACRA
jgi:hypothetical protein